MNKAKKMDVNEKKAKERKTKATNGKGGERQNAKGKKRSGAWQENGSTFHHPAAFWEQFLVSTSAAAVDWDNVCSDIRARTKKERRIGTSRQRRRKRTRVERWRTRLICKAESKGQYPEGKEREEGEGHKRQGS